MEQFDFLVQFEELLQLGLELFIRIDPAEEIDADRKLIAQEMDTGFFAKMAVPSEKGSFSEDMLGELKALVKEHPDLLTDLLKETVRAS